MGYHIHATVNTARGEYDHTIPSEKSLDDAMKRIIQMYPKATSIVWAITPNDNNGDPAEHFSQEVA